MINTPLCSVACRFSEKTRQAQAQMVITHFSHDWYRPVLSTERGPAKQHVSLRLGANATSRQWSLAAVNEPTRRGSKARRALRDGGPSRWASGSRNRSHHKV